MRTRLFEDVERLPPVLGDQDVGTERGEEPAEILPAVRVILDDEQREAGERLPLLSRLRARSNPEV